jgi:nucleotide-binding universal stress UspA family protein
MVFRTLVVGTDFSPEAELAVMHAVHIAHLTGGALTLVHAGTVIDVPGSNDELRVATYTRMYDEYLGDVREKLAAARRRAERHGVITHQRLVDGFADTALPRAARELRADLVAVGSHGRTGLKRLLLGSVAERVVRLAGMSVLVAREPVPHPGYHRLLVPVDFSRASELALGVARRLAAPGARVEVVPFWQPPPASRYATSGRDIPSVADRLAASSRYEAGRAGESFIAPHRRAGVALQFRPLRGTPSAGIPKLAGSESFDLVVLGSHGRRGLRRVLLGSVAEIAVRRAPCSVLVVK